MMRSSVVLLLGTISLILSPVNLWADERATGETPPQLDRNDPLLRALQELQRDVDELRGEIQGSRSPARTMPAQKPDVPQPAMQNPVQGTTPRNPVLKLSNPTQGQTELPAVSISPAKSDHWSFQPITAPGLPPVQDQAWGRDDLDRFILARLEQAKLKPNPDADRNTLLRRVAFDLTGLPPAPSEIRDFVKDPAPLDQALARVVDRYLASPRFGERWGRHWLDVVRYADSVGRNWNAPFTYAWRYRNFVIDSFNEDQPYDRFITEQLAGDLLGADDLALRRRQVTATGFLALGAMDIIEPEGESLMMDRIDEQIDVTTRSLLGITVACARCHDHKYEPVTMRDYYALAGVFYSTSTKSGQRRGNYVADDDLILLPSEDGRQTPVPGVHSMADMTRKGWREVFWTTDPNLAMAAVEGRVQDCPVRLQGEFYKRGPIPPRGDFHFAGLSGLSNIAPDASGRLELAGWITSAENPLTARVMVNRIWQHLFGRGLVETVDNFGQSGSSPTHPQLLDHLASRFQQTWSIKSLIRAIVLSRTYRLSSAGQVAGLKQDAANRLYWRANLKRLEVEAVRDSILSVSGRLSLERPEGIQVAGYGGKGRWGKTRSLLDLNSPYRTVYLPVLRSLLPEMYATFDFPNPTQVKGQREVTTVAPQALFLMNSDFATRTAGDTALRILEEQADNTARLRAVYLRILGRLPDREEIKAAEAFMRSLTGQTEVYRWSALIQALFICGEFRTLL